jgi:hypothetical protein
VSGVEDVLIKYSGNKHLLEVVVEGFPHLLVER